MKHRTEIGTLFVYTEMERIFHRRTVYTDDAAVGFYLHYILPAKISFVHSAGTYPHGSVAVFYRQISSRCRRHSMIIQAVHYSNYLIRRMKHTKIHIFSFTALIFIKTEIYVGIISKRELLSHISLFLQTMSRLR